VLSLRGSAGLRGRVETAVALCFGNRVVVAIGKRI
jgi:hypothetical protein